MKFRITLVALLAAALAFVAIADTSTIEMGDYGTSHSITNTGNSAYTIDTVLIKYAAASTNTITFSRTSGGTTYQLDTEVSSNAAAATDVWENPYSTLKFYNADIFVIATTDTNVVLEVFQGGDTEQQSQGR